MNEVPHSSALQARRRFWLLVGLGTVATACSIPALAGGPQGGSVVRGEASISASETRTTVRQTSKRAVVDWRRFDVGKDHHVVFDQPGAQAATLNRVRSGAESTIAGRISAPGAVVIQNTAGVVFKGSARVDVGSLVATSQLVDAELFQRTGRLDIAGGERPDARVVNEGTLTVGDAGLAALIGGDVANHGVISAQRGTVVLASGEVTTLDFTGDGLAKVAVDGDAATALKGVVQSGTIDADRVLLTAGAAASILDAAINVKGVIRAANASGDGGRIELLGRGAGTVEVAGTLDASGLDVGGDITVTGADVTLNDEARVAATGDRRGGSVRLGGDRQGAPPLRRAARTTIAAGADVDASGGAEGGRVIVWSDEATRVAGRIAADGEETGGFIETSSRDQLAIADTASIDTGAGGHWLLDPRDIVIANNGSGPNPVPPGATPFTVSRNAVRLVLNAGSDVTITTAQPASTMAGDITVASTLDWNGAGNLALIADRDVVLNRTVRSRGRGDFSVDAGRNLVVNGTVRSDQTGDVRLTALTGDLIVTNARAQNRQVRTNAGDLSLAAPQGSVLLRRLPGNSNNIQVYARTGSVDIRADQDILVQGGTSRGTWVRVGRAGNASDVRLTARRVTIAGGSAADSFAEVVSGPGGSITVDASERITVQDGSASPGRIQARNGASLALEAPVQTWDGLVQSGPLGAGGDVRLAGDITATVAPEFALDEDRTFILERTTSGGAPSSYTSSVDFTVSTSGLGTITSEASIAAERVMLLAEESVTLGAGATIDGTGVGDAIVIAAGRGLANAAGAAALRTTTPGARWLVYLDAFAGLTGDEPAPGTFDLYGRTFASDGPASLAGFAGNRLVYAEQPTLTLTATDVSKTYGDAIAPGFTVQGLRPRDTLATALDGAATVTSSGAADAAPAGTAASIVSATASAQGYRLTMVDGTVTTQPASLTVAADDATRIAGTPDPSFSASFTGFVLGEGEADLSGALGFTTTATVDSPPGPFAITPEGLTSTNYAITFVPGLLTVTAATTPPTDGAPVPPPIDLDATVSDIAAAIESFAAGVPPVTPADASFRTTLAEASSSDADAFNLGFSLGETVQQAPVVDADLGAVAPAAGPDIIDAEDAALLADLAPSTGPDTEPRRLRGGCGGVVSLGGLATGCRTTTVVDDFWSNFSGTTP